MRRYNILCYPKNTCISEPFISANYCALFCINAIYNMFFTNLKDKPTIFNISLSSISALESSMFFRFKIFQININYKTALFIEY